MIDNPTEVFLRKTPEMLQKHILRSALDACRAAHERCAVYGPNFKLDILYSLRRAEFASRIENLALPAGWDTEVRKVTSTHYVSITSPDIAILSCTRTERPLSLSRRGYWETTTKSRQTNLFDLLGDDAAEDIATGDRLLAVLVYGGPADVEEPAFVEFVFPDAYGLLVQKRVDLLETFPAISGRAVHRPVTFEPEVTLPSKAADDEDEEA